MGQKATHYTFLSAVVAGVDGSNGEQGVNQHHEQDNESRVLHSVEYDVNKEFVKEYSRIYTYACVENMHCGV